MMNNKKLKRKKYLSNAKEKKNEILQQKNISKNIKNIIK